MQSWTAPRPGCSYLRVVPAAARVNMHSACTQHALSTQSACNQHGTHHALITHSACTQHALSMHSYAPDDPLECLHVQIVHEGLITYFQPVEDIVRKAAQLRVAPFGQPLAQHLREIERGPVKGARISRNQRSSEARSAHRLDHLDHQSVAISGH